MLGPARHLLPSWIEKEDSGALHLRMAPEKQQQGFQNGFLLAASKQHLRGLLQCGELSRAEFGRWHSGEEVLPDIIGPTT